LIGVPAFSLQSLSSRIVVFFALLLAAVLAVVVVVVTTASYGIARQQNAADLATGERVFQQLLAQNREQLTLAARVLTSDFGFRQAVTSNDLDTVLSALDNHARRIDADAMMLVSLQGVLLADTLHPERVGQPAPVADLLKSAAEQGSSAGVLRMGAEIYQAVVVPVLAPQPAAWVILGFLIDDALARDLQKLTSLQVSFVSRDADGQWATLASTLPLADQSALLARVAELRASGAAAAQSLLFGGFGTLISPLQDGADGTILAVLQRSLEEAVTRFDPLRMTLLGLAIIAVMLAVIGSVFIARRITRPLNALAGIARQIQEGDYSRTADVAEPGEIGALAASFNHMRDAIAFRESEIRRLAFEDTLTGLPNRAVFAEQLDRVSKIAVRSGSPFSVMFIDLDRFKNINDTLGHEAGDEVLQVVARRLRTAVRESDLVARFGGDEFFVLLPTTPPERIGIVVERIRAALESPVTVGDQPIDISGSIGIADAPAHGNEPSLLMRRAEIAMYSAKRARSGFAIYDASHDQHRGEHLHLLGELRKAVEESQLLLYFQPKVNLRTGRTVGAEALVRWQHPVRGMVPPGDFVPFAEHTGAIRMVTRWVIQSAVRQCVEWRAAGLALHMSINVSARDLADDELPDFLAAALRDSGVPPEMLCLEITESALMEDPGHAQETVRRLHAIGVELSIDDYGIGHSSLAYVKNLPVNELKIDRTFVMNMALRPRDVAIVRSAVELGHNLDLRVTAEGLETNEDLRLLRELRCDLAQGYLISRPVPAAALESWLKGGAWAAPWTVVGTGTA
jgi:diguanylate cyclase (GGDEF)-like protein